MQATRAATARALETPTSRVPGSRTWWSGATSPRRATSSRKRCSSRAHRGRLRDRRDQPGMISQSSSTARHPCKVEGDCIAVSRALSTHSAGSLPRITSTRAPSTRPDCRLFRRTTPRSPSVSGRVTPPRSVSLSGRVLPPVDAVNPAVWSAPASLRSLLGRFAAPNAASCSSSRARRRTAGPAAQRTLRLLRVRRR